MNGTIMWFFGYDPPKPVDDNYIIQQYTGLLDKNGKKIFEGDVVEYTNNDGYCIEDAEIVRKCVIWHKLDCAFYLVDPPKNHGSFIIDSCDSMLGEICPWDFCNVIGNIFENPELLENKQ